MVKQSLKRLIDGNYNVFVPCGAAAWEWSEKVSKYHTKGERARFCTAPSLIGWDSIPIPALRHLSELLTPS
jgi:hypothetical protein